jgi:hypothetical protein
MWLPGRRSRRSARRRRTGRRRSGSLQAQHNAGRQLATLVEAEGKSSSGLTAAGVVAAAAEAGGPGGVVEAGHGDRRRCRGLACAMLRDSASLQFRT